MITLYTAIGTYKLNKGGLPTIISGEREYSMDLFEVILWSTLAYRILSYEELKKIFCDQVNELHISNERGFDHYLNRLLSRKLIASGSNYTGVDALYNLMGGLHIELLPSGFLMKVLTFIKLLLHKNLPFRTAVAIFHREKTTPLENWILSMLRYQSLTTAELIMCSEKEIRHLNDKCQIVDVLYSEAHTNSQTLFDDCYTAEDRNTILTAVANLYLQQRINFHMV